MSHVNSLLPNTKAKDRHKLSKKKELKSEQESGTQKVRNTVSHISIVLKILRTHFGIFALFTCSVAF